MNLPSVALPDCNGPKRNPKDLSFADLSKLIEKSNPREIDDLLDSLGDFRENYVLAYQSESAQADLTSPTNPRVIMFSPQMLLAYVNCKEKNPKPYHACNALEIIYYNEETKLLEAREVVFPGKNKKLELKPRISEANPNRCLSCHGNPIRAIFEPYNAWPGFYGSLSRNHRDKFKWDSREHRMYESFLKEKDKKPRYAKLYYHKEKLTEEKGLGATIHSASSDPNFNMSQTVSLLDAYRLKTVLTKNKKYKKIKYVIHAFLKCGANLQHYLPPNSKASKDYESFIKQASEQQYRELKKIEKSLSKVNPITTGAEAPFDYFKRDDGSFDTDNPDFRFITVIEFLDQYFNLGIGAINYSNEQSYTHVDGDNRNTFTWILSQNMCDDELEKLDCEKLRELARESLRSEGEMEKNLEKEGAQ